MVHWGLEVRAGFDNFPAPKPFSMNLLSARRLLLVGSFFLAFTHCARLSLNDVRVVGRNFDDEVQQTQNLTFTFNKNVGPRLDGPGLDGPGLDDAETRVSEWDSTQYIRFIPAVRGKFKWTAPNELIFSPAVAFDPATDYRAELTDEVLNRVKGQNLNVSSEDIAFHTPYLQVNGVETWWTKSRETGQPVAKTRLNFNYPVRSAEVAGKLAIAVGQKNLTTQLTQSGSSADGGTAVALTLPNAPGEPGDQPLAITVAKGLAVPNTAYQSKEAIEQTATLPSRTRIEIADVQTGYDKNGASGPQGTVRVITTQELMPNTATPGNLSAFYTIQPQVETTAELTENGFVIRGNFNETDTYVLTLTDQIRGVLNTQVAEPVTRDLFFGKMPASVSFATKKAIYLSAKGARNIGLNIVNVPKVQVKIAKVYENNILQFLKNGRYDEYQESADGQYLPSGAFTYNVDEESQYSDVLVNKTVDTGDLPKVQGVSALNVALPDQPNAFKGVYLVTVGSKNEAYLSATQLVSVSDIGLIARKTDDNLLVFANSIRTAEPLKNIEITLISSNNQAVYTLKTDDKGVAIFEKVAEKAPGFSIALLTARTTEQTGESDFNFLYLPDTEVETSRFDVAGKRVNKSGFDAFIYGDRNIYRPGETIHFNTVIRTQAWQSVGEIPVLIRVLMPNGREYRSFRKTTNEQGAVLTDVPLDPAAVTGTYTLEVLNANEVLLASEPVSVEEFIPDRIKVDVQTDKAFYPSGQTVTLSATALNLFGPPAADRAYEIELQLKRKAFAPKGFEEYSFAIADQPSGVPMVFEKVLRQGRTDAKGQVTERFPLAAAYQDIGLLEGKLFVTVFDENGRPVNRLRRFDVLTQPTFFGVRLADRYVTTNAPMPVDLVALDKDGTYRKGASATVDIVRFDYQTVIEKKNDGSGSSQLKYTTKKRETVVYTNKLAFGTGKAQFRYVPTVSGEYEIRVRRVGGLADSGYMSAPFYAYGYGSTSASSFEVSSEGQVLMTFDKPAYETGDKAKVLFKAPFNGKLLVTVERNRVLEYHWLTTENKSAEFSFSVGDEHLPNVYVTATLIRPIDFSTNLPLTVAHGFAPVLVSDADTKLPVALTVATQSRSKTKQVIRVKTKANTQVTVAVVDEGILQLKNFKTPDPYGYFYQKQALEVGSHDLYALLFPELSLASAGRLSSTGGDGYDLEKRVNPLSNGRIKLVTFWSGQLTTGFNGEAEFTIDVPQFSGDLRVMAVAYKDNAFGSANANMKVADPIVISAGVPRFLTPGDELDLPVNLSNTTSKAASITAKLSVSGPLDILTDSTSGLTQKLTIQPGRESRTVFRVRARQAIGPGAITVTVNGLNETFTEKTDLTVRPAASLVKTAQSGIIAGGKTQTLSLAANYLPGTGRTSLTVSRSPAMQFGRELSFLLGYPHGCMEQTISKAFPQLYFADLVRSVGSATTYFVQASATSANESNLNPATNVRLAIQQVEANQLFNGSVAMWSGETEGDDWATTYAVHFLTEAQQAGYEVSGSALSKAIDYLTAKTSVPATENDVTYDETGGRTVRKIASRTAIYGLYALTLAGKPNRSAMNYYKEQTGLLTPDSRYLLASAFLRVGDTRSYTALLPKRYTDQTIDRQNGGSYTSPLRNLSLTLLTLLDTDPDNLQIPVLARQLSGALKQSDYINTQEAAYGFLALGKLARKTAGSTATATISSAGKAVGTFTGVDLTIKRVPLGQPITIRTGGSGNLYYFTQSEGIPATGVVPEGDNGLQVRRVFLNREGQPMSSFRQNDLIVVKITLQSSTGVTVPNVVVTDLLPAGFEIENPRLSEARDMPWLSKAGTSMDKPDHFDVRDDRINYYTTADGRERAFYYQVRAVSKGKFVLGPASADAMYSADYRSYSGAGVIRVE